MEQVQTKNHTENEQRLEDIRAMMHSGHKSIRLELHSLVYWGLTGGLLIALLPFIFEQFTDYWVNITIFISTTFLALTAVAIIDYRKTQNIRHRQEQSVSFVQKQITRIWWMLIATGLLLSYGMVFFGGGYMEISMWVFIVGLGLVIHGLFSPQPLNRFGIIMMTLAVLSVFAFPYNFTRWLGASLFAVGMPLIGYLLYKQSGFLKGAGISQLLIWMICVSVPAYAAFTTENALNTLRSAPPVQDSVMLAQYLKSTDQRGTQIVSIPAGSSIPFKMSIAGNDITDVSEYSIPIKLEKSIDVVVKDGKMTGMHRVQGESWQSLRSSQIFKINALQVDLNRQDGLQAIMKLQVLLGKGNND